LRKYKKYIKGAVLNLQGCNCLINILEEREKEEQEQKIQTPQHNHIKNIYNLLIKLNVHNNNMGMIDNWVLFIKSQNDFSKFF
jgi:hypothetical protein